MSKEELKVASRDTETLIRDIKKDLLLSAYRPDSNEPRFVKLNQKIERLFEAEFNVPIFSRDVTPYHIMGSPGHGKTTCFKVAAKWFSDELDMNLVVNPTDDYQLKDNDFLMVILDLSGETSNIKFIGLPAIRDYESQISLAEGESRPSKYTTSAPPKSLQSLSEATASLLLLDDFSNASPSIQNIGLSIMLEKGYQALKIGKNTFVNSTGNLGSLDGTSVSPTSTAMASRRQTYIATDTPDNWAKRTRNQFQDNIGDAGLGSFFEQFPECFDMPTKSKKGEAFACPRSWSHFLPYAREAMHIYEHQLNRSNHLEGFAFDLDGFIFKAEGHVGTDVAPKLRSYYLTLTNEVTPIAKLLLAGEPLSEKHTSLLSNHASKGGNESEFFFSMLTRALGERTASMLSITAKQDRPNYIQQSETLLKNFSNAMLECGVFPQKLNKISEGMSCFAHKLAMLNQKNSPEIASFSKHNNQPIIEQKLLEATVRAFASNPKAHQLIGGQKIAKICCIDILSNMSRITSTQSKIDELSTIIDSNQAILDVEKKIKQQNEPAPMADNDDDEISLPLHSNMF